MTITATEQTVFNMLSENTGRIPTDSGDHLGRNFEQYIGKTVEDVKAEPKIIVSHLGETFWVNAFHHLTDDFTLDEGLDQQLQDFIEKQPDHRSYGQCIDDFLTQSLGIEEAEIVGGNTFNEFTVSSTNYAYYFFPAPGDEKRRAIILTHNGCDALTGYSTPHVFVENETNIPTITLQCPHDDWLIDYSLIEQSFLNEDGEFIERPEEMYDAENDQFVCPQCQHVFRDEDAIVISD